MQCLQGEDPSLLSQVSRDSTMSMTSLRTGYSGDTASLPSLMGPQNDWEIAPMDIEILRRDDGSPWELGAGAFGKVRAHSGAISSPSLSPQDAGGILTAYAVSPGWNWQGAAYRGASTPMLTCMPCILGVRYRACAAAWLLRL